MALVQVTIVTNQVSSRRVTATTLSLILSASLRPVLLRRPRAPLPVSASCFTFLASALAVANSSPGLEGEAQLGLVLHGELTERALDVHHLDVTLTLLLDELILRISLGGATPESGPLVCRPLAQLRARAPQAR